MKNTNTFLKFVYRYTQNICPDDFELCCMNKKPKVTFKKCGFSVNKLPTPRITSKSEKVRFGEFPWTVLILESSRHRLLPFCAGSLIHPKVALTAAHCVFSIKIHFLKVRAGEWKIRKTNERIPHQDRKVAQVIIHPHFKADVLWNDVALLFLKDNFRLTENVGFICLSTGTIPIDTTQCIASGWGQKSAEISKKSSILRKVVLGVVPRRECQSSLRNTRLGGLFRLHHSFVCAGGKISKDSCKGDGGGSLICPIINEFDRFVQIGIVSWGIGCGTRTPGVYGNILAFVDWIEYQMSEKNLTTEYYKT